MAVTPERNISPSDPPSGSTEAANALLELRGGPPSEVVTARAPKSILRTDHKPLNRSPRRQLRPRPKPKVTFDNSPSKPASMAPSKKKNTASAASSEPPAKRPRIVVKAKAKPPRKPPAVRKPLPPKKAPPKPPSPTPQPPESSPARDNEEEPDPSPHDEEDPFADPIADPSAAENDDIQEIPREVAATSFPRDDEKIELQTSIKVLFSFFPANSASQFRGISVPIPLTRYPEERCGRFGGLLLKQLDEWLEESKKRVAANLEGHQTKHEYLGTTTQLKKSSTSRLVHSDQWAADTDLETIQQSVYNLIRQIQGKGAYNLHVIHQFRVSVARRVVPGRWQGLTTPSSTSRGSISSRSRDIRAAAAAEADENDPFQTRRSNTEIGDISRLSDRLNLSAKSTRSSAMQEVVAAQQNARTELFAQLSQQQECRDRGRCPNCKKESKLASWCFVKGDRTHLALTHDDLLKWADLIEKKQERASLDHIPESVYDRALLRLVNQKRGSQAEVSDVLSNLGPDDDVLSAVLGRPGKANVPKLGRGGVGSGNIINVNGGGGDSSQLALALVNALSGRLTPQQPSLPPPAPWAAGHAYTLPTAPSSVGGPVTRVTPPPPRRPLVFSSSPVVPDSLEGDGLLDDFLQYVRRRRARHHQEKQEIGRLAVELRDAGVSMLRDLSAQPDGWFVDRQFGEDLGSFLRQCVKDFVRERNVPEEGIPSPPAPLGATEGSGDDAAAGSD